MKTSLLLIIFCILFFQPANAQFSYSVSKIADSLKENASIVIRNRETVLILKNEGVASLRERYVFTVLNPGGDKFAVFHEGYDKLRKVSDISGKLYNADGVNIRSVKNKEIRDYSNTSEGTLADDDRVKVHDFSYRIYPYTVEYESTTNYEGIFSLPHWSPNLAEAVSLEQSSMRVEVPAGYSLRYKIFNLAAPIKSTLKNTEVYEWNLQNFKAVSSESYTPRWEKMMPFLLLAPSGFEMQKFSGDMNSWANFGNFIYQMNKGRDVLPAQVKQMVHNLTDALPSEAEKINRLYKYLQQNTRYISIQFGIGGWQTLDANFVAANGYGDCKALTNYMYALLKEAGIKSYYTLVKSGEGEAMLAADFPCNQFDHVILCVPGKSDTTWLECTNQTTTAGYLGSFTSNRDVLLIDENGGKLARTPEYGFHQNHQVRKIEAKLDDEGNLYAEIVSNYFAEEQDELHSILHAGSRENIDNYMKTKFDLASYELETFSHQEKLTRVPSINEAVQLKAKNYASSSGKRLFIAPNVGSVSKFRIKNIATRKYDFEFSQSFTHLDTVTIEIPKGFEVESLPKEITLNAPLVKYHSAVKFRDGKIFYVREYVQQTGIVKTSEVKLLSDVFEKIFQADHARVVFVKQVP